MKISCGERRDGIKKEEAYRRGTRADMKTKKE